MSRIKIVRTWPFFSKKEEPSVCLARWKWAIIFVLSWGAFVLYVQPAIRQFIVGMSSPQAEKIEMRLGGFSPDNRLLSYDVCRGKNCYAGLLDLHASDITKIVPPDPDEWWSSGYFSPSGKYLAFAVKRRSENSRWSQLGLYDIETASLKKLTQTQSLKEFPSFSPDEKRMIYAQANSERENGKIRFSCWDMYELDIDSGQERRLTDYQFFLIGRPFYLPDGKQFIFSGEGPSHFLDKVGIEASEAYEKKYQDNTIFILDAKNAELRPVFSNGQLSHSPMISKDGKRMAYVARSDDLNRLAGESTLGYTYDLFMLEDGSHRRLTNLKGPLRSGAMSPDGSLIAYVSESERNGEVQLWILDVSQNQLRKIDIDTLLSKNQ
ncbi:MAG: hypothetical protein A2521_08685 [Deltaproteobacteria bacterium RIFOXYD12_FULL_57_12]|nr:MAG: hypothetical protein A2521_08685 [Deltaproteobacteria bacterium RIFOXYD12_FULL_57_12]